MDVLEDPVTTIEVKEAVRRAKEFAASLFEPEKISRFNLEAVERTEDDRYWLVTLGFSRRRDSRRRSRKGPLSPLEKALQPGETGPEREYKVFQVDATSGEVVAMKIFEE